MPNPFSPKRDPRDPRDPGKLWPDTLPAQRDQPWRVAAVRREDAAVEAVSWFLALAVLATAAIAISLWIDFHREKAREERRICHEQLAAQNVAHGLRNQLCGGPAL